MRILMKSMMAGSLVSLAAVLGSGSAKAGPCVTTTMDQVEAAGFSCTVGLLTFSKFSYSPDGFSTTVPATSVGVAVDVLTGLPGLAFNGAWDNSMGTANDDIKIDFTVMAPAALISGFTLALDGVKPVDGTNPLVTDTATLNFPNNTSLVFSTSDNLIHSTDPFGPFMTVLVQDDIIVKAGGQLSSVHKTFTVPGPIVGAGLPGLVAACAGLIGLARRRRRRVA